MMTPWRSAAVSRPGVSLSRVTTRARLSWLNSDRLRTSCFALRRTDQRDLGTYRSGTPARYSSSSFPGLESLLHVSEEVADAIATNKPVVALESTIYTHGALGADLRLETIVRDYGGVPAICGIYRGVPTVGLKYDAEVIEMMREGAQKVSRRDLALLVGMALGGGPRLHGGTTIAGTMILARLAGIRVFGTGGLGGVHRGGENSMDISADLTELGRTRMAVISSGCKGFLDIPKTLEYLETQGVVVSTFQQGRTGNIDFPAFWARESGVRSPSVVANARQAAATIYAQEQLGLETGLLFANPAPELHAIPSQEMEGVINRAVREAADQGYTGSSNTPFVLSKITEYTDGLATKTNIKLVQDNVRVATKVAVELSEFLAESHSRQSRQVPSSRAVETRIYTPGNPVISNRKARPLKTSSTTSRQANIPDKTSVIPSTKAEANVIVAGSVALDLSCDYISPQPDADSGEPASPKLLTSNPATIHQSVGGVGHNVALAAHRIGGNDTRVKLLSLVGADVAGKAVLSAIEASGMDTSGILEPGPEVPNARTAQYVSINDSGKNLVLAMADMNILTSDINFDQHRREFRLLEGGHVVVDGNWAPDALRRFLIRGRELFASCIFEPVSVAKSERIFLSASDEGLEVYPRGNVQMATPNAHELKAMYEAAALRRYFDRPDWFTFIDILDIGAGGARDRFVRVTSAAMTNDGVPQQCLQLLPFFPTLVVTMGDQGVFLAQVLKGDDPRLKDPDHAKYVVARARAEDKFIGGVYMRLYPAVEKVDDVVSVNGVGDTFLGALVAGMAKGGRVDQLINTAQKAAVMSLRSREAVSPLLGELTAELDMIAAENKAPRAQQSIEDDQLPEKQQLLEWEDDEASTEMDEHPTLPVLPDNDQFWGHSAGVAPIPGTETTSPPEQPSRRTERPDNRDRSSSVSEERWGEPTGIPPIPRGEKRFQPRGRLTHEDTVGVQKRWGTPFDSE